MSRHIHAISLVAVLVVAAPAAAAGFGAQAVLDGGRLTVEAYYRDNSPAGGLPVTIINTNFETVAEGKTDDHGRWSVERPPAGAYRVRLGGDSGLTLNLRLPDPAEVPGGGVPYLVSDGPTRGTFTRPAWVTWLVGLGGVVVFALVAWAVFRKGGGSPP
jgi:hypothetical protein